MADRSNSSLKGMVNYMKYELSFVCEKDGKKLEQGYTVQFFYDKKQYGNSKICQNISPLVNASPRCRSHEKRAQMSPERYYTLMITKGGQIWKYSMEALITCSYGY